MKKIVTFVLVLALLLTVLTSCLRVVYPTPETSQNTQVDDDTTEKLINETAPTLLRANVVVSAAHYNYAEYESSQGSGVIFCSDDKYLYILTNHHVVHSDDARRTVFTVRDAFDNTYTATLVAKNEAYDLAVIRISRSETTESLNATKIAQLDAPVDTAILSIGNPSGVHNSVSIGKIIYIKNIANDALDIDVAYHTAPLEHGSSGGGIFNSDGELVGINYAVGIDSETGRQVSFAVPVATIRDFLGANNLLPVAESTDPVS